MPLPHAPFESLSKLVDKANDYAAEVHARATQKAYLTDFESFASFCAHHGLCPLPAAPATLAVYVAALAEGGRKPSTIERALAGIAHAHRAQGFEWQRGEPVVARVMRGIRRRHGRAVSQKAPVVASELAALVATLKDDLMGQRDRALLTLGWFGAFRRSELVALCVRDIEITGQGLVVSVRTSKRDQEGRGAVKGIPYASHRAICPVRALSDWLFASKIEEGPIFRGIEGCGKLRATALSDRMVARIVQRSAAKAGLDPRGLGGHSLRAGFATAAARQGKSLDAIMRQTLHTSEAVARRYLRHARVFDDNAASGLA